MLARAMTENYMARVIGNYFKAIILTNVELSGI